MYSDVGQLPANIIKADVLFEIASNKIRSALVSAGWKTDATVKKTLAEAVETARQYMKTVPPRDDYNYDDDTLKAEFLLGLALFSLWCQDEKDPALLEEASKLLSVRKQP